MGPVAQLREGRFFDCKPMVRTSLKELVGRYGEHSKGKRSAVSEAFHLKAIESYFGPDAIIQSIDRALVEDFLKARSETPTQLGRSRSVATLNREFATLRCMFRLQQKGAEWMTPLCWPPTQSDRFQLCAVAAMAAGTAPGWLKKAIKDPELKTRIDLLRTHLRSTTPPHDYARVWLLWASLRFPGILNSESRAATLDLIWKRQHADGGWAVRDFAAPGLWGDGARKKKIEGEPDFGNPPSDGHMTGFAVTVLRDCGVPATDPRIEKAVSWLLANQRESGRWWARSLNSETYHYLTYNATCFALTALMKCGRFPPQPGTQLALATAKRPLR